MIIKADDKILKIVKKLNPKLKKNKYKNKWTQCKQNHNHQSAGEARYCDKLNIMKKGGLIKDYFIQHKFPLDLYDKYGHKYNICNHIVDFCIINHTSLSKTYNCMINHTALSDTLSEAEAHEFKGKKLPLWKLKYKLFKICYPDIPYKIIEQKDI